MQDKISFLIPTYLDMHTHSCHNNINTHKLILSVVRLHTYLCSFLIYKNSTIDAVFFFIKVHPMQGSRTTEGRVTVKMFMMNDVCVI